MSFGTSIQIGSDVYSNVDPGVYIKETSTADEPHYLVIDRTIASDGESSFVIKTYGSINSPVAGLPDDKFQVHVVFKYNQKRLTPENVHNLFSILSTFITVPNLTKIARGER